MQCRVLPRIEKWAHVKQVLFSHVLWAAGACTVMTSVSGYQPKTPLWEPIKGFAWKSSVADCIYTLMFVNLPQGQNMTGVAPHCQPGGFANTVCTFLTSFNGMLRQKTENRRGAACFSCCVYTFLLTLKQSFSEEKKWCLHALPSAVAILLWNLCLFFFLKVVAY